MAAAVASHHPSPNHKREKAKKKSVKVLSKPRSKNPAASLPDIDIFANHRLVDSPRRIQYERTQVTLKTYLSSALDAFQDKVVSVTERKVESITKRAKDLGDYVIPRISKLAHQSGLKILKPKYTGSVYDGTHVVHVREVDILVQFESNTNRLESMEAGYNVLPLKHHKEKPGEPPDPHRYGRSEDGMYLSSMVVAKCIYELIERALKLHPWAELLPFTIEEGEPQITVAWKSKQFFHFIPSTSIGKEDFSLVTTPYINDENPGSEIMWRVTYGDKEKRILQSIDQADRGVRRRAFMLLKALFTVERTLQGLTSYHLKTVLFHAFDCTVDCTPRWQWDSVDTSFMTLLKELHHHLSIRSLPHFFINDFNLLGNMDPRRLAALQARLKFLLSNQNEVVRMLNKHCQAQIVTSGV